MTIEAKEEWKQINDWAIAAGKEMQSPQTGLLHYCCTAMPDEAAQTIPIYENILFSLALMRSRTTDNVMEAKAILDRMLAFQAQEGNFPIYVHEFPHSRDKFLGAYILPPLYWILMQFHTVLGQDFSKRLEKSAHGLLTYTLEINSKHDCPPHIKALIGSSAIAFGRMWKENSTVKIGEGILGHLPKELSLPAWASPIHIAHLLAGLQMIYPSLKNTPWGHLLESLANGWHPGLAAPTSPNSKELQMGLQPSATFFDLWMSYYTKSFAKRIHQKQPFLLQGALIHSTEDVLPFKTFPCRTEIEVEGNKGVAIVHPTFAYSIYQNQQPLHPSADRGRRPFRLIWGSLDNLHSFVLENGNISALDFEENGNQITLIATLNDPIADDDREKRREIAFFCDLHPELQTLVAGKPGTIFKLDEPISFVSGSMKLQLTFSLLEGQGNFLGHLMRGNRPSQTLDKGSNRYTAYDLQILLRTLRRSHPCKLKIVITIASS